MIRLSTGDDSTLGNYLSIAKVFFGKDSGPAKWLEQKISEAPNGADEEVIAPESQMIYLLGTMM